MSVLSAALAVTLCLFTPGVSIIAGSQKESKVDSLGDPSCWFEKARGFYKGLPECFQTPMTDNYMKLVFHHPNGQTSTITGEAGDEIGRGGRASICFLDEAAFLLHYEAVKAALSQTADTVIEFSSMNGPNAFYQELMSGRVRTFKAHWSRDPRKGEAWLQAQKAKLAPVIVASEILCDPFASTPGQLIPSEWVQSAIGAREKLGRQNLGNKIVSLDPSDQGQDRTGLAVVHGCELVDLESWLAAGSTTHHTAARAKCEAVKSGVLIYDAAGVGAGVRGAVASFNEVRTSMGHKEITAVPYVGASKCPQPDAELIEGRTNKDAIRNLKSHSYWLLRTRLEATHRAVAEGAEIDDDSLISIRPDLPELADLISELCGITYEIDTSGRILIGKKGKNDTLPSPGRADAWAMALAVPYLTTHSLVGKSTDVLSEDNGTEVCQITNEARRGSAVAVLYGTNTELAVVYCTAVRWMDNAARWCLTCEITDWDLVPVGPGFERTVREASGRGMVVVNTGWGMLNPRIAAVLGRYGYVDYTNKAYPAHVAYQMGKPEEVIAEAASLRDNVAVLRSAWTKQTLVRRERRDWLRAALEADVADITPESAAAGTTRRHRGSESAVLSRIP